MWTAALWGLVAGAALLVGAGIAMVARVPARVIGAVMGFGSGVLFSAVAFELTEEAISGAGLAVVTAALLAGAGTYLAGDWAVSRAGAHRRKSPLHGGATIAHHERLRMATPAALAAAPAAPATAPATAAGALVVGALLDGIPESAAIGISLLDGGGVGVAFVAAVFLSNVPEGMAATAGLMKSGRRRRSILGLWLVVALASAVAAGLGYAVLGAAGPALLGGIQAFAAGAVLAMLATTMLPEAVDHAGRLVGLVTVLGFAAAVLLGEL
jgi:ZIP family zinc transporter